MKYEVVCGDDGEPLIYVDPEPNTWRMVASGPSDHATSEE